MKRLVTLIVAVILFAASLVSYLCVKNGASQIPSFGRDYAVVRVFDSNGFTPSEISSIRYAAEAASTSDASSDGRLWCDAYSYFTEVYVSRPNQTGIDCQAIVTGGDFFLLHSLDFENGWYYTEDDLHLDRVVVDERLAFQLFGSNDIEDMTLTLGSKTLYVAGVVNLDESKSKELQLGDAPLIYIPQHIAEGLFGERDFENYEIMLQNPVDSHAINALASVTQGKEAVDVTNRFSIKKIFGLLKEFPIRSYRTHGMSYPYWENTDRGTEDVLAVLLVVNAITLAGLLTNIVMFISERKKR